MVFYHSNGRETNIMVKIAKYIGSNTNTIQIQIELVCEHKYRHICICVHVCVCLWGGRGRRSAFGVCLQAPPILCKKEPVTFTWSSYG